MWIQSARRVGDVDRAGEMRTRRRRLRGVDGTENDGSGIVDARCEGYQSFRASEGKTRGDAMVLRATTSRVARARAEGKSRSRAREKG